MHEKRRHRLAMGMDCVEAEEVMMIHDMQTHYYRPLDDSLWHN